MLRSAVCTAHKRYKIPTRMRQCNCLNSTVGRHPGCRSNEICLEVADFRSGSIATEMGRQRHVRFPPGSDRATDIAGDPFGATESREPDYSITCSARASRVGGTVSPSALAVFRLITNSKFVGCKTGISAGFEPFRICPT